MRVGRRSSRPTQAPACPICRMSRHDPRADRRRMNGDAGGHRDRRADRHRQVRAGRRARAASSAARSSTPTRCSSTAGMDIGTAKPTPAERGGVAASSARRLADHQVGGGGRVPGPGPRRDRDDPSPRPGRRCSSADPGSTCAACSTSWCSRASRRRSGPGSARSWPRSGPSQLHARLARIDPAAAASILPTNGRRIVRALEVIELTGAPVHRDDAAVRRPRRIRSSSASSAMTSTSGSPSASTR